MKVVAINGSARKDGNTQALVEAVFAELRKAGAECEPVQLAGADVRGCRACWGCGGAGNCVRRDDFCDVFEKMKRADAIVLASPVYAGNVSAAMQALLERAAVVCDMNRDAGLLSRKAGACVAVARRAGAVSTLDAMARFFLLQDMYLAGSTYWPVAYGQMPGDVEGDAEGMRTMARLGENLAHLLRALA